MFRGLSDDERAEFLEALNYDETNPEDSTATIQYEWEYSESRERWSFKRWGSERTNHEGSLSQELLQSLPVTFLGALRDAARALAPGRQSRLARLLASTATEEDKKTVERIHRDANRRLEETKLLAGAQDKISQILKGAAKTERLGDTRIQAAASDFERILQSLRVLLRPAGAPGTDEGEEVHEELTANGLGYNNLIYIAVVLSELEERKNAALPLLLVEEPEAHLHPQLQTLLTSHLERQGTRVQTIVTTHSPTIAAHVRPRCLGVMHITGGKPKVTPIASCGLSDDEEQQLQRVLDVTRATLLFAQGVILVEGISEVLLLPALAKRLGIDLEKKAVSVVPVAGVDFSSICKLFGKDKIEIPVAIVTDADPPITRNDQGLEVPELDPNTGTPVVSSRAQRVKELYEHEQGIEVCISTLTLEYDLAAASPENALIMYDTWAGLYRASPRLLERDVLEAAKTAEERALTLWRVLCCRSPQHGKTQLAQALARRLRDEPEENTPFVIPGYLERAIRHAAREAGV